MAAISGVLLGALVALSPAESSPSASREIRLRSGESLSVTESGAGDKAVVLVPGLFGAAFAYRHVLPLLAARGFRAVVVEPLGIGDSGRPPTADYSLAAQADRIAEAMTVMGIENAVLVAHAVGASM